MIRNKRNLKNSLKRKIGSALPAVRESSGMRLKEVAALPDCGGRKSTGPKREISADGRYIENCSAFTTKTPTLC